MERVVAPLPTVWDTRLEWCREFLRFNDALAQFFSNTRVCNAELLVASLVAFCTWSVAV